MWSNVGGCLATQLTKLLLELTDLQYSYFGLGIVEFLWHLKILKKFLESLITMMTLPIKSTVYQFVPEDQG
ncbi:hypothetical protein T02_5086 [Trichinella nativa]|uniref:Uncharacterized protein n=1 Tax=Trichinella nativa TaxID=6335 RepID=A0A0V1KQF6_9BILA|nr:hypothetical protein T02_6481 [Trichinella nativa]KRZ63293.1 hypothetical protein T02_5086 [Trichinella nativa]